MCLNRFCRFCVYVTKSASFVDNTSRSVQILESNEMRSLGLVLVAPVFKDYDIEKRKKELESIKGMKARTAFITRVLVGSFGIRRFKMEESSSYKLSMKLVEKRYEKK